MKRMSIKSRVVFWYTFSMIIMIGLVFAILILGGRRAALDDARDSLIISTDMAVNNVTVTEGRLVIDEDMIYYMDHTWILLARDDGEVISGLTPEGFPENVPFQADKIRRAGRRGASFYVYDRLIENQKTGKIWIRGVTSASLSVRDPAIGHMILLFMVVLPILIILSLAGGWLITRRAFLPLKQLNSSVARIQEGSDLSERVRGQESKDTRSLDEIEMTARAFDLMLDRISESFEREKQFTNDASHELRTPVAVIRAQCDYIREHLDDKEEVGQAIDVIHNQALSMSSLIDQLLMLARADRQAIMPELQETDISLLAEEAAFACRKEASEKHISVAVEAQEGLYIKVDPSLITRMIVNLVTNSIKYGKEGGFVRIIVQRLDRGIMLTVSDNGIGIPEDHMPYIWNRFYRVEPSGSVPGLGLGLSLVKWIVEVHRGTITADSLPGAYTNFNIFLPF
ncbi:MAG: HAMP domain-containing histidine kinase [Eubacterium sp.]|nr:HAMP domain-containing histidine kinase [Eubacterium sp.]